ncbi:DUF4136 domain-containing protein [Pontiellaceae bacterium B12219]|nr:DUF4136 domain-containing protein [Pontiellaceae bacterium B12219]
MKFITPLALTLGLLLCSCSSTKVRSNKKTDYDFKLVKTYQWVPASEEIQEEDDTYLNNSMADALNNQLTARGWQQVEQAAEADIQLTYYIKLKEQKEYAGPGPNEAHQVQGGVTYSKDSKSWGYKEPDTNLSLYLVEIGTLHLQITDTEFGDLLWTGTLETQLDRSTPVEKQKEVMQKMARKIIAKVPGK